MKTSKHTFLLIVFFSIIYNSTFSQTWQKRFLIHDIPRSINEIDNGNLEIHYIDNLQNNYKLTIDSEGDSIGLEYYSIPQIPQPYFELVEKNSFLGDSLKYFSSNNEILWEIDIEDVFQPIFFSYSNFAFIKRIEGPQSQNPHEEIWVYNNQGEMIYNFLLDGPNSVNLINMNVNTPNSFIISTFSKTPFLPQGAGQNVVHFRLIDSIGNILCTESAIDNYLSHSEFITSIAYNGQGTCGSIGTHIQGIDMIGQEGQYTPCSNFLIPLEFIIPSQRGIIGLQSNAFAILGFSDSLTVVTKIDCLIPYENLCLYTTEFFIDATICEGESFEYGNESYTETGNYQVIYSDINDCESITYLNLIVEQSSLNIDPEININNDLGSIILNSDCINNCTYEWSNGENSSNIFDLESGHYYVTVTELNGCVSIFDFEISIPTSTIESLKMNNIFLKNLLKRNENIRIESESLEGLSQINQIQIYDSIGKLISSIRINTIEDFNHILAPYSTGLFLLVFKGSKEQIIAVNKIIVY